MRTLFPLLLLGLMLILSACTSVVFPEPLGKPVPASDEIDKFLLGEWLGDKAVVWTVAKEPDSEYFTVKSTKEGKEETLRFLVRAIGKESQEARLIWVEEKKPKGFTPLLVAGADDALALLYPDTHAVEKMIADGKLRGVLNKDPKAWMIEKGDWEEVLAGKEFWLLDSCQVFVRRPQPPSPPETPPASPPASGTSLPSATAPSAPGK